MRRTILSWAETLTVVLTALTALLGTSVCPAQGVNFGNPAAPPPPIIFAPAPSPLGNLWGLSDLGERSGVTLSGIYTGEILANVNGGKRTGIIAEGLLELDVDIDLSKSFGLKGGSFHFAGFEIHGSSLSKGYTGDLSGVSSIAAFNTARIAEYWYEQSLLGDQFSVKIGQFLPENEFYYSDYSNLFICGSFGAYTFLVNNFPFAAGYPMSAPAIRLLWRPTEQLDFRVGVCSGSTLSEETNNSGLPNIRGRDGVLMFLETAYKINHEKDATGLPGGYKLGCIFHSRYKGALNANLSSVDRSGYGFYATVDQALWQKNPSNKQVKPPSFGVFCRLGYMPPEFGFVSRYIDGGFNYNGLLPGRNDDIFGVGITHSGISQKTNRSNQGASLCYTSETLIEVTYTVKLTSWLSVQPDFQYIINPGATDAGRNATVVGVRSTLTF